MTRWLSARLRGGSCVFPSHPFSPLSQNSFRFFHLPVPAVLSAFLTVDFPLRENDGVSTFCMRTRIGEVLLLRRWRSCLRQGKGAHPKPLHSAFWLKPLSIFGLFSVTTFPAVHL